MQVTRILEFATGSDVICLNKIEFMFTAGDGLARCPVAHTGSQVLELPWTYLLIKVPTHSPFCRFMYALAVSYPLVTF